jgi:hypothetical protein
MDSPELHQLLGEIRSDVKTLLHNSGDHEERLRSLEKWRWVTHGCAALLGAVGIKFGLPPH